MEGQNHWTKTAPPAGRRVGRYPVSETRGLPSNPGALSCGPSGTHGPGTQEMLGVGGPDC